MYRDSIPYYETRKGADFEPYQSFKNHASSVVTTAAKLPYCGTPLSEGRNKNEILTSREELHTFVIGETGSGKTRRVILPMIRLMAKTGESMVISDPKGELYRMTSDAVQKKGYDVKVINFRRPETSIRWNPLGLIEAEYRSGDPEKKEKAMQSLKETSEQLANDIKTGQDTLWITTFQQMFVGLALMVLEYAPQQHLTFFNISEMGHYFFEAMDGVRRGKSHSEQIREDRIREWYQAIPDQSEIKISMQSFLSSADRTKASHLTSFYTAMGTYTNQISLRKLFSRNDLVIEDLGKKPTALYVILPDDTDVMYRNATLLVDQIYGELIHQADSREDGRLPVKVCFILDEFANFAKMTNISSMLTASRSRGIRFTLVCQSMEQLVARYSANDAEILMANCRVWIYLNCRNLPFLERLSRLSGDKISETTGQTSPLLSVSDLIHLNPGEAVIINDRCYPFMARLSDYSDYDFGETVKEDNELEARDQEEVPRFNIDEIIGKSDDFKFHEPDFSDDFEFYEPDPVDPEEETGMETFEPHATHTFWRSGPGKAEAITAEFPGIKTPEDLYDKLFDIWTIYTCAPRMQSQWTQENRTLGQCSVTAFLAQDIFGGQVQGIRLPDGNYHCFNVVGEDRFDLTSEQFTYGRSCRADEVLDYQRSEEQFREVHFAKEEKKLRYEFLKAFLKCCCQGGKDDRKALLETFKKLEKWDNIEGE